jgi:hypothetical protein
MRLGTAVWMAVLAVCLGATVLEVPDAKMIWRRTTHLFARVHKEDVESAVPDELVATDPEAGDMLRYSLKYSLKNQDLEELAALVVQYPQNEFFLALLAEQLATTPVVDPRAPMAVVDRLLALDPNNAHYRYLRGWVLLAKPDRPGREQEALSQLEVGRHLPEFYLPYGKYKQRVDRLCEQAVLAPWDRTSLRPFYSNFGTFFRRSQRPCGGLDRATFDGFSKACADIATRLVDDAHDADSFGSGAVLLRVAERARLSELDLSEAQAHEARLRLGQAVALTRLSRQWSDDELGTSFSLVSIIFPLGLILAHVLQHPIGWLVGWPVAFIAARRRPASPRLISIRGYTFFIVGMGALLCLVMPIFYGMLVAQSWGLGHTFGTLTLLWLFTGVLSLVGLSPGVRLTEYASARGARRWGAIVCGLLWLAGLGFCIAWHSGVFGTPHALRWGRSAPVWVAWSAYWLLVWSVATCLPYVFRRIPHNRLVVPALLWVAILLAVPTVAAEWHRADRLQGDLQQARGPLPAPTQETYERVILASNANAKDPNLLPEDLGFAAPQDLEAFLAGRRAAGRPVSEEQLRSLLERCGRDAYAVILGALKDHNDLDVLTTRAKHGDTAVKDPLERIFEEKRTAFARTPDSPKAGNSAPLWSLLELAGLLARISDPKEGEGRFLDLLGLVVEQAKPQVGEGLPATEHDRLNTVYCFWEALGRLPRASAATLMRSYLRQTEFFDLAGEWKSYETDALARRLAEADREFAEEIVEAIAQAPPAAQVDNSTAPETALSFEQKLAANRAANGPWCLEAISPSLGPESIPLLCRHLHDGSDSLRAFVVGRLTSLGYEWSPAQVQKLRTDPFWMVRLNALFASGPDAPKAATSDKNSIVRAVATVLIRAAQ